MKHTCEQDSTGKFCRDCGRNMMLDRFEGVHGKAHTTKGSSMGQCLPTRDHESNMKKADCQSPKTTTYLGMLCCPARCWICKALAIVMWTLIGAGVLIFAALFVIATIQTWES